MMLNSEGQVTIPVHLRAKYGLHPGDEVEVVEVDGTLQIVRPREPKPEASGWSGSCATRPPARTWRA
jgi:AbrB family looped-hinge helix DNA binding protein